MMIKHTDTNTKMKRERSKQAVVLAMESRWEEAVSVNQEVLDIFPDDVESLNRLGKALSELGHYSDARQAFQKAVDISPSNTIAKKNLERIASLGDDSPQRPPRHGGVPPHFFIEETGKTGITVLVDKASKQVLARVAAGDPVFLESSGNTLLAKNNLGENLGAVEPKLGMRLLRLMRGGNKYEAATTKIDQQCIQVIIKEVYRHPSQIGRLSFPPKGHDSFRPYVWEGAFHYGAEDDDAGSRNQPDDWGDVQESGIDDALVPRRAVGRPRRKTVVEEDGEL